jgi:oxygen-dependent protoporphyrinogen oxidase
MKHVVIIGGGIAGLAAAYRLRQASPGLALTLLERDRRLGGKILTERVDGFVIEGGPDTFLALKPRGLGLCRELGIDRRLHGTNENIRRTYVMRDRRLYELPEGLTGLIPTRLGPMAKTGLISALGKLRMGLEVLVPPRASDEDESLAAFVERRLGRELYDRMIEPLMSGIYAGDGECLSLAATFPQLRQAERAHGGLIKGVLAARRTAAAPVPGAKKQPAFLTPTTGLAEIVEALAKALDGVDVRLGMRVDRVEASSTGYRVKLEGGDSIDADSALIATPAFVAAGLVAGLDDRLAQALQSIPYVSTATVSVAYRLADIPRPLDGYGYIVPRAENRPLLACTWTSTKFPHRAPEGFGLIRAFVGRAGKDAAAGGPDDQILDLVRAELQQTLGITAPPLLHRIFRWPDAMPQYTLGHLDRLALIERCLSARPGLFLAGSAYRGVGLPDCIASGEAAAEAATKFLSADTPTRTPDVPAPLSEAA